MDEDEDEEEEASEAPSPRVITKDMNSASKTRTQGTAERVFSY